MDNSYDFSKDFFSFLNQFKPDKEKAINDYLQGKITKEQLDEIMGK